MSINSGSVGSGTVCNSENDHGRNQAMVNGAGMTRSAHRKTRAPLYVIYSFLYLYILSKLTIDSFSRVLAHSYCACGPHRIILKLFLCVLLNIVIRDFGALLDELNLSCSHMT